MKKAYALLNMQLLLAHAFSQVIFSSPWQVLEYAGKNSIIANQGIIKEKLTEHEEKIARSGLLPKINLYTSAEYYPVLPSQVIPANLFGGSSNKYHKVQFGLPWNFLTGAEISLPVVNPEKWEQVKTAGLQRRSTAWNNKADLESLHIQIIHTYYRILLYKELIRLNSEYAEVANEFRGITEERKKSEILSPADFNRAQYLFSEITSTGEEHLSMYKLSVVELKFYLNIPQHDTLYIIDSLTTPLHPEPDRVLQIKDRPSWHLALVQADVARQSLVAARKASLPRLSLYGRYNYQWQMQFVNSQQVSFDVSSIGLRADLPLFAGNYYKLQQKKNEAYWQLAKNQQQQVKNTLEQQHLAWQTNYHLAVVQYREVQHKLKSGADNLRIARLSYQEGVMEFDEFSEMFKQYSRIQTEKADVIFRSNLYYNLLTLNHD